MQKAFVLAHTFTAKWEGGFTNHKNDPGGATNYGVSLRWLQGTNKDGRIDAEDMRHVTPQVAAELFQIYFWDFLNLGKLPVPVAVAVYDTAVNCGCAQAVKLLQRACNTLGVGTLPLLGVDGRMGAQTRARIVEIERLYGKGCLVLANEVVRKRAEYHTELASRAPVERNGKSIDYRPFLKGWINRCNALQAYVSTLPGGVK